MRPGRELPRVKAPILFSICALDSIAPPKVALEYGSRAPNATFLWFDHLRHYDIYHGEGFEKAMSYYIQFLSDHLPIMESKLDRYTLDEQIVYCAARPHDLSSFVK